MKTHPRNRGYALIEAMVALVVVSIGGFGLLKLNTEILRGSGDAKTRLVALQLAQSVSERIRNYNLAQGCPTNTTQLNELGVISNVGLSTTNALYRYQIDTTGIASPLTNNRISYRVCVAWDPTGNPACSVSAQSAVKIQSIAACNHLGTSGNSTILENEADLGNTMKTPTGSAVVGGDNVNKYVGDNSVLGGPSNQLTIDGVTFNDNTITVKNGGLLELVDQVSGQVLLTVKRPLTDDEGTVIEQFSTISGRVLIETNNSGVPMVNPLGANPSDPGDDLLFALSSDASVCIRLFTNNVVGATNSTPGLFTFNGGVHKGFYYTCYVSRGWWGNIGMVRLDNANTNDRVCVGDPDATGADNNASNIWNRMPQLSISRGYRAYEKTSVDPQPLKYTSIGIGLEPDPFNPGKYIYTPQNIVDCPTCTPNKHGKQDFLLTRLTGSKASCAASGVMKSTTPPTFNSLTNRGRFYCISNFCPTNLTPPSSSASTTISGSLDGAPGISSMNLTGVSFVSDPSTVSCTFTNSGSNANFSCTISWLGEPSTFWSERLQFTFGNPNVSLCPVVGSVASSPTDAQYSYTINKADAAPNGNTISFVNVATSMQSLTFTNIKVTPDVASCTNLGTPDPVWANVLTTNNPSTLSWSSIPGASLYGVLTCQSTTQSKCTPNQAMSPNTQTGTSYTLPNNTPSNNRYFCIQVRASAAVDGPHSSYSPVRCVLRDGNKYTHD